MWCVLERNCPIQPECFGFPKVYQSLWPSVLPRSEVEFLTPVRSLIYKGRKHLARSNRTGLIWMGTLERSVGAGGIVPSRVSHRLNGLRPLAICSSGMRRSSAQRCTMGSAGASDRGVSAERQDPAAGLAAHPFGHPVAASKRSQVAGYPGLQFRLLGSKGIRDDPLPRAV